MHAAPAPSNLDAAIPMRFAKTELQHTIELRAKKVGKTTPELAVPMRGRPDHDPSITGTVSKPSAGQASPSIFRDTFCTAKQSISCICYLSKTYFVQHFPQKLKAEDVKTKLSCETSLKVWKLKMWKRSCPARLPSKSWKLKMWKQSFRARPPSKSESWRCENEAVLQDFPQKLKAEDVKTKLSCETSLKKWKWKMWKRSFGARPPSKSDSGRSENEAFVRDVPKKVTLENVKTKLSCETSFKFWKFKFWKWIAWPNIIWCFFESPLHWSLDIGFC